MEISLQVTAAGPAKKGFGPQQPQSKKKQKAKAKQEEQSRPYKLQAQPEQTPAQDLEANTVKFLVFLFVIFFCEGIFLAIAVSSAFDSTSYFFVRDFHPDAFAQDQSLIRAQIFPSGVGTGVNSTYLLTRYHI
jgi:hypothetical protein